MVLERKNRGINDVLLSISIIIIIIIITTIAVVFDIVDVDDYYNVDSGESRKRFVVE